MAWLSEPSVWAKRVPFTVDKDDIDENLTHFAVLVHLSAACGKGGAYDLSCVFDELESDANRKKIAITKADGTTQLYVEIEKWDDANEQAWLHVSKSDWVVLTAEDTPLVIYYDKVKADNTAYVGDPNSTPAENVWDSNFKLVCHMRDDPDTSHVRDSTGNNNDGTKKAVNEPIEADGKIAKAQDFVNAPNDYIEIPDSASLQLGVDDFSIEFWAKRGTSFVSTMPVLLRKQDAVENSFYSIQYDDRPGWKVWRIDVRKEGASNQYAPPYTWDDDWHRFTWVRKVSEKKYYLYEDGSLFGSSSPFADVKDASVTGKSLYLGNYYAGSAGWNDLIDEVRISNIVRTPAWIKASYESEIDHLLDFGIEETPGVPKTSADSGSGVESASRAGWLMKPSIYTKDAFEQKTYTGE